MFQLSGAELLLRLEHRHSDGSWSALDPRPGNHDPADHDPERGWAKGQLFKCKTCDEEVRVMDPAAGSAPGRP